MEKSELVNDTTTKIIDKVRVNMEEAFTLGMKYMKLKMVEKLVPILEQNEFDQTTIAIILRDIGALEELTYADVFDKFEEDSI
jgi:hypothetical protein